MTIKKFKKENIILKSTLGDIIKRLNTIDQQARSDIEIQCVPEHRSGNVVNTVLQLGTVVSCKIADGDILHATGWPKWTTRTEIQTACDCS